jgi:ABC-type polysaccharide/polyol phosphate export permease
VTKIYFPREILVVATVFSKIVDLLLGVLILLGLMALYSVYPSWTLVWVPAIFAMQLLFTVGISLPLAALNLFFHDVRYLVGVILMIWFYITPIIYPLAIVPERYKTLFELNPLTRIVDAYRRVLLDGASLTMERFLVGMGAALLVFLLGYYLFKRMEAGFADRI